MALELVVEPEEVAEAADDSVGVAAAASAPRPDLVRDVRALRADLLRVRDSDHVPRLRLLVLWRQNKEGDGVRCTVKKKRGGCEEWNRRLL